MVSPTNEMKLRAQRRSDGNVLLCALCTIVIISLIGANVLINCTRSYNVTAKQLKGWKEALYAAEAGGDAGFDEVRKALDPINLPFTADGWTAAPSPAPTPGPAWTKTISGFGEGGNLSTTVTIDKLTDNTGTIPSTTPYYRIRAIGTARLYGLPRVGLADQFFTGSPNFVANSASRGVGDTLLRKIDFKYDHFKATYGDGDGHNPTLSSVANPQVTRRIELVVVPKYYVFGGALRIVNAFNGPGSNGNIDSYSSINPNNPNPPTIGGQPIGDDTSSYWGPNPTNVTYLADAHDGDVSVGTANFIEGGPIWGDVTTNGGNVTHSGYQLSGTIDNNVPLTVKALWPPPDTSGYIATNAVTLTANSINQNNPDTYVYSSINNPLTITNGNASNQDTPYAFVKILVNGDITARISVEKGVTAQIWFTGNMQVQGIDIDNQNVDLGRNPITYSLRLPTQTNDDIIPSRAGHLQFYGLAPENRTQTIIIDSPGNIFATFYAPRADITLEGNPDVFSAIVAHSFLGNSNGNGNTGFHYDKWLNKLSLGVVQDYQIASYVEDVR